MPRKSTKTEAPEAEKTVKKAPVKSRVEITTKPDIAAPIEEVRPVETKTNTSRVEISKPIVQTQAVQRPQPVQNTQQQTIPTVNLNADRAAMSAVPISGVLEVMNDGSGYVRPKFTPTVKDAFIAFQQVRRLGLRPGDMISGYYRMAKDGEKNNQMLRIDRVNGLDLTTAMKRPYFADLVPIYAEKQLKLETEQSIMSTRIIDLFSPIGFGQRGMIVSPPKAGKTTLLKEIAAGVAANYPEVHLMAVLVGERPEEVTDMQRFVKGEVIASSFDQKPEEQTKAAEIAIERAKRLVEMGKDVFMVFDSITRLARAYNLAIPTSGRTLSGGFDPAALYPSKKFFGAARNIENGGSLTIIGTALVETGSKLDDLVFEEFKGTGNMELRLTRNLAERRIFPAFDILKSGTRKEEFLLSPENMIKMTAVRRMFDNIEDKEETTIMVVEQMAKTKNNEEFMKRIGKQ